MRFRNPKPREVTLRVRNLGVAPRVGETGGELCVAPRVSTGGELCVAPILEGSLGRWQKLVAALCDTYHITTWRGGGRGSVPDHNFFLLLFDPGVFIT